MNTAIKNTREYKFGTIELEDDVDYDSGCGLWMYHCWWCKEDSLIDDSKTEVVDDMFEADEFYTVECACENCWTIIPLGKSVE